jgi:hypothetical protein
MTASWADLFDRAAGYETSVETIRDRLREVRADE